MVTLLVVYAASVTLLVIYEASVTLLADQNLKEQQKTLIV